MYWPYIILSYVTLFSFGLSDNVRGALFPLLLKDYAVTNSQGSLMFALGSAFGFLAVLLSRPLFRKYEKLPVLRGTIVFIIVSLWGMGLATTFPVFLAFSALFGGALGILGLIPNVLVSLGTPLERRQQVLSGLHSMYGLSSLLAPLVASAVVHMSGGKWQWTFLTVSTFSLGLLFYSIGKKDLPKQEEARGEESFSESWRQHLPQIFFATLIGLYVVAEIIVCSRLSLLMTSQGYTLDQASFYLTGFFICMLLGRLFFSFVKLPQSLRFQLSVFLVLSTILSFLGIYASPVFFMFTGLTMAPFFPLAIALLATEFPKDLDSAVGYIMMADYSMLALMHVGMGFLTDSFGISSAMLLGPCVLIISFFMLNSFPALFKKKGA